MHQLSLIICTLLAYLSIISPNFQLPFNNVLIHTMYVIHRLVIIANS